MTVAPHRPAGSVAPRRAGSVAPRRTPRDGPEPALRARLNRALFAWHRTDARDLAFRQTRDPFAILVAEVMLQQTQVARVEPAWRAFMGRFPTVESLAAAPVGEVLRAWAGLGYYGRAVRLQKAAKAIVERHGGRVPDGLAVLMGLPGIGGYTARAIAATAFMRPVAPVDTNIGRVVRRVFGAEERDVQPLADGWIAPRRPAAWTHAAMDLGATVCRARDPLCGTCPLRLICVSAGHVHWAPAPAAGRGRPGAGFPSTRRWLRGRILERLTRATPGSWLDFEGAMGTHPPASVGQALHQMAADGLVEIDVAGRARLPVAS
jgi:A/G-specific adenine glycosylase